MENIKEAAGPSEEWKAAMTPETSKNEDAQKALDWWHNLPVQSLTDGKGWANLVMLYYPDKTHCYHMTEEEVLHIYKSEMKRIDPVAIKTFTETEVRSLVDSVTEYLSHNDPEGFDVWFEKKLDKLKESKQ